MVVIRLLITLSLLGIGVLGFGKDPAAEIRIISGEYPPFIHENDKGSYKGIAHEVILAAFKEVGKVPQVDIVPFGRSVQNFLSGVYQIGFFDTNTLRDTEMKVMFA